MEMPPLRRRRHMAAPRSFCRAILPIRPDNARAAVTSLANAPSTSVRSNTAIAGSPVENARLADSGTSLAPPFTLILVLALLTLRIGFAAEIPLSIDEAFAVLLATAWAVVPILLGAEPTSVGSELRHPLGMSILGGLLVSQMPILFTTPVIYLLFDRLLQRYFNLEAHDAEQGSPAE